MTILKQKRKTPVVCNNGKRFFPSRQRVRRYYFFIPSISAGTIVPSATSATGATRRLRRLSYRRAELVYGESHVLEESAGVIVASSGYTLLIRYRVVGSLNEELCGTDYFDYGKYSERDVESRSVGDETEVSVYSCADILGYFGSLIYRALAASGFNDLCVKNYGFNRLDICNGVICCSGIEVTYIAVAVLRSRAERNGLPFSTVKDDILLNNRNSGEVLAPAYSEARLALYKYIVADGDLIETAIERNFIYTYISPEQFRTAGPHAGGRGESLLAEIRKVYARILKAIAVAAAIEHAVSVYAHRSPAVRRKAERYISVFWHYTSPSNYALCA